MTHTHSHETAMTFEEKLIKLFHHWIQHNNDHADSYREWSQKAGEKGHADITAALAEAASLTDQINQQIQLALKTIEPK